jgi:tetratricopeptide (TPR) repeat protein
MEDLKAKGRIELATEKYSSENYEEMIKRCTEATGKDPNNDVAFVDWGVVLFTFAFSKKDEALFKEAGEKFEKAIELNPENAMAFYFLGCTFSYLANTKNDESLFRKSYEKFEKATELDKGFSAAFSDWGNSLYKLAKIKGYESLYREAFEKYEKATELNPKDVDTFYDYGTILFELARIKGDESLYREAFEKYARTTELYPKHISCLINWGIALSHLAKIKKEESLFKEAFEKYEKAMQLESSAGILINWANALFEFAKIKKKKSLFREAFEMYDKTTELDPKFAEAFYNWGIAIYEFAKIKNNESLFRQAFEKYEKATELNPKYTEAFNNWGIALSELAEIKEDEALFREAFEKYDKATELQPNQAYTFHQWGVSLARLAIIKEDEALFKEAFEKYEKAELLNIRDLYTLLSNWGMSLYYLAKIKNDESLFRQSIEKFMKAAQLTGYAYILSMWGLSLLELAKIKGEEVLLREACEVFGANIQIDPLFTDAYFYKGVALYYLAKINSDETLFNEAVNYFEKSKKDILYILVYFDNEDREYIFKKEILNLLLDLETVDGQFFKKITKNIDKNKLKEYKKAYILSISIISQLHINNSNEKLVAHYRDKIISQKLIFDDSKFRLNAINYSNDPKEGRTLLDYFYEKEKAEYGYKEEIKYGAFAGCFTFNHNSLNQFRLYGKEKSMEGTGLSLVFSKKFFSEDVKNPTELPTTENKNLKSKGARYALFRCIYIDPAQRVETVGQKEEYLFYRKEDKNTIKEYHEYKKYISNIVEIVRKEMEILKKLIKNLDPAIIGQLLINLRYLSKHIAFKEEQECRIVKIYNLNDKKIKINNDFKQMYVKYNIKVSNHIKKIYFGPKADGMELFQDILRQKGLIIPCEKSNNPLT